MVVATALVFFTYDWYVTIAAPYHSTTTGLAMYRFLTFKWGFDTVYNRLLNKPLLEGAYNVPFSLGDKGLIEIIGPTGLGKLTLWAGRALARVQTGRAYDYAGSLLVAALGLLLYTDHTGLAFAYLLLMHQVRPHTPTHR
jgi:NADH:ubiquinone oxidoreductase subunit 5 (subunit L)/multisubunit Na+/H+ antiporter MnhA subunit